MSKYRSIHVRCLLTSDRPQAQAEAAAPNSQHNVLTGVLGRPSPNQLLT